MNVYYLVISWLLQYPDWEVIELRRQANELVSELPKGAQRNLIERFFCLTESKSETEIQTDYVATFDFNKKASLYLSFHGLGDRRERGMAMLNLKQRYRAAGMEMSDRELPDYLPLVLEFCAYSKTEFAQEIIDEFRPSLELVRAALEKDKSAYQYLLAALLEGQPELSEQQREKVLTIAAQGPPTESVGLDSFTHAELSEQDTELELLGIPN